MKVVKKKAWPELFEAIYSGAKKFDLRLDDFKIEPGDTLILQEWDPKIKKYTGRELEKKATYVMKFKAKKYGFNPQKEVDKHGLQIISLE